MPEGPEIKYLREYLLHTILGKYLIGIEEYSKPLKDIETFKKIIEVGSKGKNLWIRTESQYLLIHLGLTGWLSEIKNPNTVKYVISFAENQNQNQNQTQGILSVSLNDSRKLSLIKPMTNIEFESYINKLGPDIFTKQFTLDHLKNICHNKNVGICGILTKQELVSGIGNYIKSEVLYISRINPYKKGKELSDPIIETLYKTILHVAFSCYYEYMTERHYPIPPEVAKLCPDNIQVPYLIKVYKRKFDDFNNVVRNDIIYGRATFWAEELQQ